MPAISFPDLDPQDGDSELILLQKTILSLRASAKEVLGGDGDTTIDPQETGDSWTDLHKKLLRAARELQEALEA